MVSKHQRLSKSKMSLLGVLDLCRMNLKGDHHEHNRKNLRAGFVAIDREPR
jgi:hypothetical protein